MYRFSVRGEVVRVSPLCMEIGSSTVTEQHGQGVQIGHLLSDTLLSVQLPQILILTDGTEVRVSQVHSPSSVVPKTTIKFEFDSIVVFVSTLAFPTPTYGFIVPVIQEAISALRSAQCAIMSQPGR